MESVENIEGKLQVKMSVIIPTHGRPDLFEQTLKSVLSQTADGYEVVVTDDSSYESERIKICDLIRKHDIKNIVRYVFTKPNLLQAPNTNQGINIASGEYLRILHSDDLISENCIKRELQLLEKCPEIDFLYHDALPFVDFVDFNEHKNARLLKPEEWLSHHIFFGTSLPSGMVFRRSFIKKIGMLDEKYRFVCDWKLFLNVLVHEYKLGKKVLYLPPGHFGWRRHEEQITSTMALVHFNEYGDLLNYMNKIYITDINILSSQELKHKMNLARNHRYSRVLKDYDEYKNFELPSIPFKYRIQYWSQNSRYFIKAVEYFKMFIFPMKYLLSPFFVMFYLLLFVINGFTKKE